MPAVPSWLLEPLWGQFSALLSDRPAYDPSHPLGCHRPRMADRVIFEELIQVLRFGCSYQAIADCACGATTIRQRRDEWIRLGIFAQMKAIARDSYDRIVGLALEELAVDGCITKAPGGGQCAGRSPVDRGKPGMKRSLLVEGKGIPLDRVLAPANRNDSVPLAATLDKLGEIGPLPEEITVHLDAGYDSGKTRTELESRIIKGEITQRRQCPDPGRAALAHRAHQRLAQRVLRPRRRHHHPPSPHPRGMDPLPMGHPPGKTTLTRRLSARLLRPGSARKR